MLVPGEVPLSQHRTGGTNNSRGVKTPSEGPQAFAQAVIDVDRF
jgi:hypothetical protein